MSTRHRGGFRVGAAASNLPQTARIPAADVQPLTVGRYRDAVGRVDLRAGQRDPALGGGPFQHTTRIGSGHRLLDADLGAAIGVAGGTDDEAVVDRGDIVAHGGARESHPANPFQRRTRFVQIDVEHLHRLVAAVIHHVQLRAAVGPKGHVDAVRPKLQRVEIRLRDEPFGVERSGCAVRVDLIARTVGDAHRIQPAERCGRPRHPRRQHPFAAGRHRRDPQR